MWIVNELRYLKKLFVKNICRLLHLLSTSARKSWLDILNLLKKYYNLLFADTPTRAHQRMVDFNRWVSEVLSDNRAEEIESYGETPWLALEEMQPQDEQFDEVLRTGNAANIQLLKTACEFYMQRCSRLLQTNTDLTNQVEKLKTQLNEALTRASEAQQALEREKEHSALQAQRLAMDTEIEDNLSQPDSLDEDAEEFLQLTQNSFQMLDSASIGASEESQEVGDCDSTSTSELDEVNNDEQSLSDDSGEVESEAASSVTDEQTLPQSSSDDVNDLPKERPSEVEKPALSFNMVAEVSSDSDYQQLTQVNDSGENGTWYRQALRSLKVKREQHQLQRDANRKTNNGSKLAPTAATTPTKEVLLQDFHHPTEYEQLVATRKQNDGAEDSVWYRKALQLLKQQRESRRNRAISFSSTISIVD